MNEVKPQYVGGFAILFWGFQCDLLWFAIPMSLLIEARYFVSTRWAFNKKDFYQIGDLTIIALTLAILFLSLNRREYHLITTLLTWIPILIYPLVICLGYSTSQKMPLDILFYSLRRQQEPINQSWDMDYILLGACLVAAGFNSDNSYYFAIVTMILAFTLFQLHSPRWNNVSLILSMIFILLSAAALQHGIRATHLGIKAKTEQLIARWISNRTDPLKTRTAIGKVGELKLSDAIAFRIEPLSGEADFPVLLQEATYNSPTLSEWEVFDLRFQINESADDYRWEFFENPAPKKLSAKIYIEFDRPRALIPVPAELTEIRQLPAKFLKSSANGTIQATGLIPSPHYLVSYKDIGHLGHDPSPIDLNLPSKHQEFLEEIIPKGLSSMEAIEFVKNYFADFRYTLYQPSKEIEKNPLIHFMRDRKAGHCEYFASATAMMLRKLGIPARYVTGYAIQEWNKDLSMYIVRERHAHAWAVAYINNKWIVIDTTPSEWLEVEESEASSLQPLQDFLSNNWFLLQQWLNDQELEDYQHEMYLLGIFLMIIFLWRITNSEQVKLSETHIDNLIAGPALGKESPFFNIEQQLLMMGYSRNRGELMRKWLIRIERPDLLPLLAVHNRWRFDPRGISITEKRELYEHVRNWLNENSSHTLGKHSSAEKKA